ncbi:tRNA glutamyl-Q(34) synthetase GluQRS [Acidisphaera sp. L21]|uniref:tRNA glutamyl-Q(34) synthetase GluQRS n=1 Tax=Acidisphaera sp. L21 TaxID=1641851 RepID=UPI00131DCF2B|nr:tRNA glutamyl-Q(34) synthetase GluQRS [Acidisphaera sp. L21]
MSITTRFAPSPTGMLHLGHAFVALDAWQRARRAGGRFLLRVEDIDANRCRPDYTRALLEDLRWLGLDWDGAVRMQSAHLPEYRIALDRLQGERLLYPCFCTRADVARSVTAPHGPDGAVYPGTCRHLSPDERARRIESGAPFALRLDLAAACIRTGRLSFVEQGRGRVDCQPERFGDVVLSRRDAVGSYHLCVTHDDAAQGVTLVSRGTDLLAATDIHRVLQALMGWPEPEYVHLPLLTGPDGRRLSKRDGADSLRGMREAGRTPADVRVLMRDASNRVAP